MEMPRKMSLSGIDDFFLFISSYATICNLDVSKNVHRSPCRDDRIAFAVQKAMEIYRQPGLPCRLAASRPHQGRGGMLLPTMAA
jgi:hypothetical protein